MVGMELRQQLKLVQQLVMTPQLQQAIKLLQLSRTELVDMVQQEMEENPVLEELEDSVDRTAKVSLGRGHEDDAVGGVGDCEVRPAQGRRPDPGESAGVVCDRDRLDGGGDGCWADRCFSLSQ